MSAQNYTLPITKMAYVDKRYPTTNYSGGTFVHIGKNNYWDNSSNQYITRPIYAYLFAAGFPNLEGLLLTNLKLHYTMVPGTKTDGVKIAPFALDGQFNESGVTYNARPSSWTPWVSSYDPETGVIELSLNATVYSDIRENGIGFEAVGLPSVADVSIYTYLASDPANRPYFTYTITESIPSAVPVSPMKKFVDVLNDNTFIWEYVNAAGGNQKSFELQISSDGTNWRALASGTTSLTSVIVPRNTLTASDKYWRVRVVSENNAVSPWSSAVEIKVVAAPSVMINVNTQSPRPLVSWTCDGQLGYRVICGENDSGVMYGTTKNYQCPIYLPDGEHEISVQTQGNYSLWSQPSNQIITVQNVPGEQISLTVYPTHRAKLAWSGGQGSDFYILRDGIPIAKTDANTYTDEFVIGKHSYQVLEALADGNYTLSNTVTATMRPEHTIISRVPQAAWQDISLSRETHKAFTESHTATVVMVHYAGRKLPVPEKSEFVDQTLSFTVAFRTQKDAAAFEELLGEIVCYKTPIGRMMIGVLAGYTVDTDRWFSQYSCTITKTDYREVIAYD